MSLAQHSEHVDGSLIVSGGRPRYPVDLRQLQSVRAANARLEAVLAKVFEEVREFPDAPPESSESYLPPHLVVEIAETLLQAREVTSSRRVAEVARA